MKDVSENDLVPWAEPDDLVDALLRIRREDLPSLRDSLVPLTEHEDQDVRTHALRRLFVHLQDQNHRDIAVRAVTEDPDSHVRRAAAFAVAATSTRQTRGEDIRVLIERLLDEVEDIHVRGAAYEALLLISERQPFPPLNRTFDPGRDVDWQWIDQIRRR